MIAGRNSLRQDYLIDLFLKIKNYIVRHQDDGKSGKKFDPVDYGKIDAPVFAEKLTYIFSPSGEQQISAARDKGWEDRARERVLARRDPALSITRPAVFLDDLVKRETYNAPDSIRLRMAAWMAEAFYSQYAHGGFSGNEMRKAQKEIGNAERVIRSILLDTVGETESKKLERGLFLLGDRLGSIAADRMIREKGLTEICALFDNERAADDLEIRISPIEKVIFDFVRWDHLESADLRLLWLEHRIRGLKLTDAEKEVFCSFEASVEGHSSLIRFAVKGKPGTETEVKDILAGLGKAKEGRSVLGKNPNLTEIYEGVRGRLAKLFETDADCEEVGKALEEDPARYKAWSGERSLEERLNILKEAFTKLGAEPQMFEVLTAGEKVVCRYLALPDCGRLIFAFLSYLRGMKTQALKKRAEESKRERLAAVLGVEAKDLKDAGNVRQRALIFAEQMARKADEAEAYSVSLEEEYAAAEERDVQLTRTGAPYYDLSREDLSPSDKAVFALYMLFSEKYMSTADAAEYVRSWFGGSNENAMQVLLDQSRRIRYRFAKQAIESFVFCCYPNTLYDALMPGDTIRPVNGKDGKPVKVSPDETGYLDGCQFIELRLCRDFLNSDAGAGGKELFADLSSLIAGVNGIDLRKFDPDKAGDSGSELQSGCANEFERLQNLVRKHILVKCTKDGKPLRIEVNRDDLKIDLRRAGLTKVRFSVSSSDGHIRMAEGAVSLLVKPKEMPKVEPISIPEKTENKPETETVPIGRNGYNNYRPLPYFIYDWKLYSRDCRRNNEKA